MKIAIIGTGGISRVHFNAISQMEDVELCAVCDINEERAKACGEKYQVPYFVDYHEIPQKTDAEAVIVTLPHGLHCESAEFFLESGLHVMMEKPMANTVEECDRMIAAAQRSGKKLAIAHPQNFGPAHHCLKKIIESEELGKLCMINEFNTTEYFTDSRPRWFLNKKMAGGGLAMNYGAHFFNKLFYHVNSKPVEIVSNVGAKGELPEGTDVEGHAQFFVRLENGITATVTFSGYSSCDSHFTCYFTEGAARVYGGWGMQIRRRFGKWEEYPVGEDHIFRDQLADFVKYVKGEPSIITTPEEGRDIIAAIQTVYRNAGID